jgi:hypothetical protein
MIPLRFMLRFASVLASIALIFTPVSPVRAGTTGTLSGRVLDTETRAPVAGVKVTATSPSQRAAATTDSHGNFAFVSLDPDEYTITLEKDGYDTTSVTGIAVFADATQVVSIPMRKTLKTIAKVTSVSSSSLVRAGTTADLYSVNAAQQERAAVLGGGGDLNSAYSAIASVPGAYVPTNQNGYNQAVHVRGGDSDEVGYEFDGIPVNRAFDNYPSGSASSLGQLELQVYTGASPADAEGQGLAGFINQVIKSGTYPGYADADSTVGTPTFYHSLNVEAGGSSPDRLFNYYIGVGGFNQDHRYIDQFDGEAYANEFGQPLGTCPTASAGVVIPPSCFTNGALNVGAGETPGYILGPMPFGLESAGVQDRTTVLNFHFAIPHKHSDLRDDVQVLYDNDSIQTPLYVSPDDEGAVNYLAATGPPEYLDTYQYTGALGQFFTDSNVAQITPYYFPSSPTNRPMFAPLPLAARDIQYNDQAIAKIQYQHAFSDDAYFRVYGYTYYSDYVGTGPASSWQTYVGYDSGDYELNSHTRGVSASMVDQLSPKHLLSLEGSYVTATSLRMNNFTPFGGSDAFAVLVNPNALRSGTCYTINGATTSAAIPTTCGSGNTVPIQTSASFVSLANTFNSGPPPSPTGESGENLSAANLEGFTCGGGPCALYTVENGLNGDYNTVKPFFSGAALTDEWRPSDKWLVNAGVRFDQYKYQGDDSTGTDARAFWFNAFNRDTCYDTQTLTLVDKSMLLPTGQAFSAATPCSSFGSQYAALIDSNGTTNGYSLLNIPSQIFTYNELQPRAGLTYTVSPDTVMRASYGKYIEQPSGAYEQYDALQQDLPALLAQFYTLGFRTPGHEVVPPVSYNADLSYEHHFKGTNLSIKVTPFLRQTHDQIENFYLNIKQGFISGLNAGNQTSEGVEFAFTAGSFDADGLAAQLGFAYTNAFLKFDRLPNGTTILSPINADIATYNAYTKACAPGGRYYGKSAYGQSLCGSTSNGLPAAACYSSGTPDPSCAAGDVANPYWNAPAQPLLDPGASYLPYSTIPGGIGTGVNAYNYPYVASLLLQWKHKKLSIMPSLQFVAGNRYGAPETTPGVDPATCGPLASGLSPVNDPGRYPYGAPGGTSYDASTCTNTIVIPDQYTRQFDGIGVFREPAQLLGHLRISYDISPKLTATVTMANLLSTCFGGQQTAFTYYWGRNVCSYGPVEGGYVNPVGNDYNPGDNVQTVLKYPYSPVFGTYNDLTSSTLEPFSIYFDLKVKM